jgi:hypothetical protein
MAQSNQTLEWTLGKRLVRAGRRVGAGRSTPGRSGRRRWRNHEAVSVNLWKSDQRLTQVVHLPDGHLQRLLDPSADRWREDV